MPPPETSWRQDFLLEIFRPNGDEIRGVRARDEMYTEYSNGEREYYDLKADPGQLRNRYESMSADARSRLAGRLRVLSACAAAGCRQ